MKNLLVLKKLAILNFIQNYGNELIDSIEDISFLIFLIILIGHLN